MSTQFKLIHNNSEYPETNLNNPALPKLEISLQDLLSAKGKIMGNPLIMEINY